MSSTHWLFIAIMAALYFWSNPEAIATVVTFIGVVLVFSWMFWVVYLHYAALVATAYGT